MVIKMAESPKKDEVIKLPENNAVIMSSPAVKPEDVAIEHDAPPEGTPVEAAAVPRKPKDDPLAEMRNQMEAAEKKVTEEREKRISAERERDTARTQVKTTETTLAKTENEKVVAQEAAIQNRVDAAKADVQNAKNALAEAIDTGKPAAVQIDLQEKLSEAVYAFKGAETSKKHFDTWKEVQKNKPVVKATDDNVSPAAKSWIDSHPRFKTDTKYRRTAERAHEDALDDGIVADSDEYFRRINAAVAPLEDGVSTVVHTPPARTPSGTSTAAPASHDSAGVGASGGNAAEEKRTGRRTFKLDGNMREQAIKIYGKNSTFKLSDDDAFKRYAARQLEIRDIRNNGGKI